MNDLCKLFGHKYTNEIESKSFLYSNNLYCCRCKSWTYSMPGDWFNQYGNGIIVDWFFGIRSKIKDIIGWFGWIVYRIKSKLGYDELPF